MPQRNNPARLRRKYELNRTLGQGEKSGRDASRLRASVTRTRTYMQTRHMGRRDDRHRVVEHRAEKKSRKDEPGCEPEGEKTYERKDAGRSEEAK